MKNRQIIHSQNLFQKTLCHSIFAFIPFTFGAKISYGQSECPINNGIKTCVSPTAITREWNHTSWHNFSAQRTVLPGAKFISHWEKNVDNVIDDDGELLQTHTFYLPVPPPVVDKSLNNHQARCIFESPVISNMGTKSADTTLTLDIDSDYTDMDIKIIYSNVTRNEILKATGGATRHSFNFDIPANTRNFQVKICTIKFKNKRSGTSSITIKNSKVTQIFH